MSPATVQQLRPVGSRLRQLREARGLSLDEVGAAAGVPPTLISRVEYGFVEARGGLRDSLLRLYANVPGATSGPGDGSAWEPSTALSPSYARALEYERTCGQMWTYDEYLLPALLQTREYAYANQAHRVDVPAGTAQRNIELRMLRQRRVLGRRPQPEITVLLDESVLSRLAALDPGTVRGQVDQLLRLAGTTWPTITLRVVPLSSGINCHLPFTIFGDRDRQDAAVVDRLVEVGLDTEPRRVEQYWINFRLVQDVALPVERSVELIESFRPTS